MGDQAMLEWLRAQDPPVPFHEGICDSSCPDAKTSRMLSWLRGQDPPCPWDVNTTAAAAGNDIGTLQWLRGQHPPCPWDASSCAAAAKAGKLEILIWLRAQDPPCPWDGTAFEAAAKQPECRDSEMAASSKFARLKCQQLALASMQLAARHLEVLQWLCQPGLSADGRPLQCSSSISTNAMFYGFLHRMEVPPPAAVHAGCYIMKVPMRQCF